MERKNRENRSENLGEAIRDNAARKHGRLKKRSERHGGRTCQREKSEVEVAKKGALPRIKGVSLQMKGRKASCQYKLTYLNCPRAARPQVAQALLGVQVVAGAAPKGTDRGGFSLSSCYSGALVNVTCITDLHYFK